MRGPDGHGCEHGEQAAEHRRGGDGCPRDVGNARAGGRHRTLAARGSRLQVGDLHRLERRAVGLTEGMPEHPQGEIVAASGLRLRARPLHSELIPVALVARSRQGSLSDRSCVLDQRTFALAEPGRQLRRLELGADAGQLAPALVELVAERLDTLAWLRPHARRECLGHELLGLAAEALELLPGTQRRRVAIVQVAAPVELRLLVARARQLVAHPHQLGRRLVVCMRARKRIATGLAQGGQAGGQLCRARLAAPIGTPQRVGSDREVLCGERRRP